MMLDRTTSASSAVAQAIRKGVLQKGPCKRCGNPKAVAHHEDYSKPLDVIWLCPKCHGARHRELRLGPEPFTKRLTIDVSESEHHALRRLALDERTTVVAIVRGMLRERLEKARARRAA